MVTTRSEAVGRLRRCGPGVATPRAGEAVSRKGAREAGGPKREQRSKTVARAAANIPADSRSVKGHSRVQAADRVRCM